MTRHSESTTPHDTRVTVQRGHHPATVLWAAGAASLLAVGALVSNVAAHNTTDPGTDHRPVIADRAPSAMLDPEAFDRAVAAAVAEAREVDRSALLDGRSFDAAIAAAIDDTEDNCPKS